jgi:type I restriction enzyme S subunit
MPPIKGKWPVVPLGDIAEVKLGKMLDKAKHQTGHRLPYLRNINVRWGTIDTDDLLEMHFEEDQLERFGLIANDVLVCEGGEPGRASVWNGSLPHLKFQKALHRVRFKVPFEPKLLVYFLELLARTGGLERRFTGSTIKHFTREAFVQLPIPVPPEAEQKLMLAEIEKQFTRLDVGVAALRRVQTNLKRYRGAVLKTACEGRLVPTEAELAKAENRKFETGKGLLAHILTERRKNWHGRGSLVEPSAPDAGVLAELPEGWVWATVEQLSSVVRGASPRPAGDPRYFGGDIPWITVGPLTADSSPYLKSVSASLKQLGREHSRYIEPDTLLLTNSGATLGVPKITLIGGCINDGVAALLDVGYPLKLYLLYFLRTQTERLRGMNQGAAQPNLNTTIIKAIHVPLPPLPEQTRIVAEVERRLSVIEELEAAVSVNLQRAIRLRQSILQNAFSGNL